MDAGREIDGARGPGRSPTPAPSSCAGITAQLLDMPGGRVKAVVETNGTEGDMLLLLSAITEAIGAAFGKPKAAILEVLWKS